MPGTIPALGLDHVLLRAHGLGKQMVPLLCTQRGLSAACS